MDALYRHSHSTYEALEHSASTEHVGDQELRIYRGSVTKLWKTLNISMGYYSDVFTALEHNSCITRIQQGGRNVDSIIVLHGPPAWESWTTEGLQEPLTQPKPTDILSQRVEDLERRLGRLNIVEALANHEERLTALEKPKTRGKADKA